MPWRRSRPNGGKVNPKYRTPEHRRQVEQAKAQLDAVGSGWCAEIVCVLRSRLILPGMDLHLCHDRRTGQALGLGHAACNKAEAGRYARSKQDPPGPRFDW